MLINLFICMIFILNNIINIVELLHIILKTPQNSS